MTSRDGCVCKNRLTASIHVWHVASTLEDPTLQRGWGSRAEPHLDQCLHLVWVDQLNTRPKSTPADSQALQCCSSPCKSPLLLPCRVSSSRMVTTLLQQLRLQPGLGCSSRDRQDATGLPLHCLVVWVWAGWGFGRREEQATPDYQVRKMSASQTGLREQPGMESIT